jgi:hypothetical protein
VTALAAGSGLRKSARAFPLWDFADYTDITTEPLPRQPGTAPAMRYYWESSHYRLEVGNLVLDRLFDCRCSGGFLPADFGTRLLPDTVDNHLANLDQRAAGYAAAQPREVAEVRELMTAK